jgi:nitric oxide dioxygenase
MSKGCLSSVGAHPTPDIIIRSNRYQNQKEPEQPMPDPAEAATLLWDLYSSADNPVLRATLTPVATDPPGFAKRFYHHLFERAPGVRSLFPADMTEQYLKLSNTVCVVVSGLDRSDDLIPGLQALGARHRGYGVKPHHYIPVGDSLLEALADVNGKAFDDSARAAWSRWYAWVAMHMSQG